MILCRHAEPEAGIERRLSCRGLRQAEVLANVLEPLSLSAVYASPQRRALETAQPIAARHGLTPLELSAFRELDFGELEGLSWDELAARQPGFAAALLREPTRVRFPGGESYAEMRARAGAAAEELIARHAGETIVAVSHAGPIRALLASWLLMADEAVFRLEQGYAALNLIDWSDGVPHVRTLNAGSLLEEDA